MTVIQLDSSIVQSRELSVSLDDLNEISSQFCANDLDHRIILKEYKIRLKRISETLAAAEYTGLWDLISIFIEGVEALVESGRELNNDECRFLLNFPNLMVEYLSLPTSKIPGKLLIRFFKNPNWVRPISESEENILTDLIYPHHEIIDEDDPVGDENSIDNETDMEVELDEIFNRKNITEHNEKSNIIDIHEVINSIGNISLEMEVDDNEVLDIADITDLDKIAEITELDEVDEVDEIVSVNLFDLIGSDSGSVNNSDLDDEELLSKNNQVSADSNVCEIDDSQQQLIDLVRSELAEVIEARDEDIDSLKTQTNIGLRKHLLVNYAEQTENISNAVELIGLVGLSLCSQFISTNIKALSDIDTKLNEHDYFVLYEWPVRILTYLQDINDNKNREQLVEFISNDSWPDPIIKTDLETIQDLLVNPILQEEEKVQRQTIAADEDVSLALPEDVNQDLLEGLLQGLPDQTEEFSIAIENLKDGGGQSDVETAQRVAHTLKGAANVVGIKGMVNLTHHLEDILEYLSNNNKTPSTDLLEILVASSDCLEGMAESLLGIDAPPEDSLSVLQEVLNCANALDNNEQPNKNPSLEAHITIPNNDQVEHQQEIKPESVNIKETSLDDVSAETMLRVPASLADELLRLAGENLISTTQIEDKIKNTMKKQQSLAMHSSNLHQVSFDLEHLIDIQGITTSLVSDEQDSDFDALEMDKFHELHSVSRRLTEISADSMQLSQNLKAELNDLHNLVIDQDKILKDNQELVLRTRMVPTKSIIARLKRGVRQASRLTGKIINFNVEDNDTYIDSEVLNEMIEPLMHILRNAVDHGIETKELRQENNKNEIGNINVIFERKGDQVVISIIDDGHGIDSELIYSKAVQKSLITPNQELSTEALFRLILEPGFSSRDDVTQTSGRGIGLDVVNTALRSLKGTINIASTLGEGTEFQILLPISSFSIHSLLVRVRQYIYAISNRGVEEIIYPGTGQLRDVGQELLYQSGNDVYETQIIDNLLNLPADRRNIERSSRPILIVKDDSGEKHAILVQEVLDSKDVVVKSMGQYMPKIKGTVGATVLGDGSIAPVIDLPELIRDTNGMNAIPIESTKTDASDASTLKHTPYVLVVDDSLSARRSLAQFVEDMGMNIRTARDGLEAASIIQARVPDLVLVDMEMPRMNGLELTAHIRANENTRHIPIIMITSRSSDKHKESAMQKGVNYFMVKPFDEDLLASNMTTALELVT